MAQLGQDLLEEPAPPVAAPQAGPAVAAHGPMQGIALGLQGAGGNAGVARALARSGGGSAAQRLRAPSLGGGTSLGGGAVLARQAEGEEEAEDEGLMGYVMDGVREIPGYMLLSQIAGEDPITGRAVPGGRRALVESLLSHGPFAAGVEPVLAAMDIFDEVFDFLSEQLTAHNLTLERIGHDLSEAWDRVSIVDGIDANVELVQGYIDRLIADVTAFVSDVTDRLLEMAREAAVAVAEPLLARPEIAPIWSLAKKVLHYDPLRGERVDAPTSEILADFLRLIGQEARLAQMEREGTLQRTADWLDTQFHTFSELVDSLTSLFADAWAAISPANLPNLLDTLPALADRAIGLVRRVGQFAQTVITQVLAIIKEALLGQLATHANKIPGFHLLTVILGRNPFTGANVPRTAENLIKGFITLMPGGEATYEQLAESGVISTAAARIEGAMTRLGITWDLITGTFRAIWDGLSLDDLLAPVVAFDRIVGQFGEPLGRIFEFVSEVVETVVSLILKLMNFPSDLLESIIANTRAAMADIQRDPVGFLKNLLAALKEGVTGFFGNVVTYLKDGLANWLLRGLGALGITLPADFSVGSILKTVLEVLGVSIENLWTKLGKKIGEEKVAMLRRGIDKLSGAWEFIKDVQENGIGAIWRYVSEQLSNLWDTLLTTAQGWIQSEIIDAVIGRLLSMLDPTGIMAVVRSFQAFFNAIQSAVEYLRDILGIVNEYVSTLAQVAAGNITAGAQKLEKGLANAIPIAIGFLANQVGIGNIPEKVVEIIGGLREMVDKALDWLVDKAVSLGERALGAVGLGGPAAAEGPEGAPAAEGAEGAAAPVSVTMAGAPHEFSIRPGAGVFMASEVPERLITLLAREKTSLEAEEEAATAAGPESPELALVRRRKIAVAAMERTCREIDQAAAADPGGPLVQHGLALLRTEAEDYGRDYGKKLFGGASTWGPGGVGTTAQYGRHKAVGLEREHVIPSAVFKAMLEIAERSDPEFRPVDMGLTTLAWSRDAAKLKTNGHVEIDGESFQLTRKGDNTGATADAVAAIRAGTFDLNGFAQDRIEATKEAATLLGITQPSASQIESAGLIELQRAWELMRAARRPGRVPVHGNIDIRETAPPGVPAGG